MSDQIDSMAQTPQQGGSLPPCKWFDRIMIINLENTDYPEAIMTAPFNILNHEPFNGTLLTNFRGLAHPSQPNYFAQVVGETVVTDDAVTTLNASCVVDLLERKGVSWAAYNEGYPDDWIGEKPFLGEHGAKGLYVRRHNPLASISSVQNTPSRAAKIKAGEAFKRDLDAGTLPQYVYYTPNQYNNAHDTNIKYAGAYIAEFLLPLLSHPFFTKQRSLFVLTFDESAFWVGKNRVATWLLGTAVKTSSFPEDSNSSIDKIAYAIQNLDLETPVEEPIETTPAVPVSQPASPKGTNGSFLSTLRKQKSNGGMSTSSSGSDSGPTPSASLFGGLFGKPHAEKGFCDKTKLNHYSLLRTVEDNWDLGNLGRKDVDATSFGHLLRPFFDV
ncbi:phosphoesterase family-domain-containing protein [Chytriomyces sp. MP71]|nr:phosphoesterase family-domain-containing protein [Chytriomyces sp. MP71]